MQPGTTLAHYESLSAIGKAGMGKVWRAPDTKLARQPETWRILVSKSLIRVMNGERDDLDPITSGTYGVLFDWDNLVVIARLSDCV